MAESFGGYQELYLRKRSVRQVYADLAQAERPSTGTVSLRTLVGVGSPDSN